MPASSLLLLESDPASRGVIAGVLGGVGYAVTPVKEMAEVFAVAADHQLIIIDVVTGVRTAADICREIRSTPALAAIPVLCISQADDVEDRIRFLEAGADDVMAKPFDARELEARVEALLVRFQRSREVGPGRCSRARHIPRGDSSRSSRRRVAWAPRRSRSTSRSS